MLKSLVYVGLATPITVRVRIGGQSWTRITDAGRQMPAAESLSADKSNDGTRCLRPAKRPSAADNPGRYPPACRGLISTIRLPDQPRDRYPDDRSPSARPQRSWSGGRCARHPKLEKPINCTMQLPVRSGRSYGSTGSWHDRQHRQTVRESRRARQGLQGGQRF